MYMHDETPLQNSNPMMWLQPEVVPNLTIHISRKYWTKEIFIGEDK